MSLRAHFLVQSCVYTNQSQLSMKSDGELLLEDLHLVGFTSLNWDSWGKFAFVSLSVLTRRKHDSNRRTSFTKRISEVQFWPETTERWHEPEKWISQKWKGMSDYITSAGYFVDVYLFFSQMLLFWRFKKVIHRHFTEFSQRVVLTSPEVLSGSCGSLIRFTESVRSNGSFERMNLKEHWFVWHSQTNQGTSVPRNLCAMTGRCMKVALAC